MGLLLGKVLFTSQMTDTSVNMSIALRSQYVAEKTRADQINCEVRVLSVINRGSSMYHEEVRGDRHMLHYTKPAPEVLSQ